MRMSQYVTPVSPIPRPRLYHGARVLLLRAFSSAQVAEITHVSMGRLSYWDQHGFVSPSYSRAAHFGHRRLYSFPDLVSLRVMTDLRREGISLRELKRLIGYLHKLDYANPLAEIRYDIDGIGRLWFDEGGLTRAARRPEQIVMPFAIPLRRTVEDLASAILRLDRRPHGVIERRRGVLGYKPVIAGTRITVRAVRDLSKSGIKPSAIISDYFPDLTLGDVEAALAS